MMMHFDAATKIKYLPEHRCYAAYYHCSDAICDQDHILGTVGATFYKIPGVEEAFAMFVRDTMEAFRKHCYEQVNRGEFRVIHKKSDEGKSLFRDGGVVLSLTEEERHLFESATNRKLERIP